MTREAFRPAPSLVAALSGSPIGVGTRNRAKLEAVRTALAAFQAPGQRLDLVSIDVASGVPEQPIGFEQIRNGARNRARAALEIGESVLAIGIEDGLMRLSEPERPVDETARRGLDEDGGVFYNVGCAWMTDGEREGHGFSAAFSYPPACCEPAVRDQRPIGDLFDALWRSRRGADGVPEPATAVASGRQGGNIGMLTDGRLDRAAYGRQAVVCALVRFLHTDLYD